MTGYQDPNTYTNEAGESFAQRFPGTMPAPGLYYNPYFHSLNIAMAPPLVTEGQVTYDDGTKATVDQMSADVAAFLQWTAEPSLVKRKQTGFWFLGFMLFATVLAYLAKQQMGNGRA